jgi:type II secretory pathway component PulF
MTALSSVLDFGYSLAAGTGAGAQRAVLVDRELRRDFYEKFEGRLDLGEPMAQAMQLLWRVETDGGVRQRTVMARALKRWSVSLGRGETLAEALSGWIPTDELTIIATGETSGRIPEALRNVAILHGQGEELRGAISRAFSYPLFLVVGLVGLFWLLDSLLVQRIMAMHFAPATEALQDFADACALVKRLTPMIVILVLGSIGGMVWALPNFNAPIRIVLDRYFPFNIYRAWNGASFLIALAALMRAGVPLGRAFRNIEQTGSPWLRVRVAAARRQVIAGSTLGEALMLSGFEFPDPRIARDLSVMGDRMDLPDVLERITNRWMKSHIRSLDRISQIGRLAMMIGVAMVLGWMFSSILALATSALNVRA